MAAAPVPVPGNAKSFMEQQLEIDKQEWDALECPGKGIIPSNVQKLRDWITLIGTCLNAKTVTPVPLSERIKPDLSGHVVSDAFGNLAGGQLMDALGDNNDCLIHSFLTCVARVFRLYDKETRSKIASYFRRFVLPTIQNIDPHVKARLESYNFLTGGEIEFLSLGYKIPIVNLQDGKDAIERSMEIFPPREHNFWNDKDDNFNGPFYFIHGDNTHFTPIRFTDGYNIGYEMMKFNYGQLKTIADNITAEHDAVFNVVSQENEKIEKAKEEFKAILQPDMAGIKEMATSNGWNAQTKSIKMSGMLEILKFTADKYVNDIIKNKLIDESQEDNINIAIYTTLLDELSKNISTNVNTSPSDKIGKLEEFASKAGLTDDDDDYDLVKVIKASLGESVNVSVPVTPTSGNSTVLRSISMKARIGTGPETQYSATVYKPAKNGGRRKTKKAMRVKKQKTKTLKRTK